jgi:formylglycine-generating enzyme required for sulfatase activity
VSPVVALSALGIVLNGLAVASGLWLAATDNTPAALDAASNANPANSPAPNRATVRIQGGQLTLSPNDWESVDKIEPTQATVGPFDLDRFEVTYAEWSTCTTCEPVVSAKASQVIPVVNITPARAQAFCRDRKGRLPTRLEWVFAASSAAHNRYPWGQTGLVCRNVVFGMVNGPCAFDQAAQPVGSRPLGATVTGLHDLAGNVAEWTSDGDRTLALGGSFRSTLAGQLKVWAAEETATPRDDIGFRCAYTSEN